MKQKYLGYVIMLFVGIVIGIFLIGGYIQQKKEIVSIPPKESVSCNAPYTGVGTECCLDQNLNNVCDKNETPQKMSESLRNCLERYVYGQNGDWVKLAEDRCAPLLTEYCMFGYSETRTNARGGSLFGVFCPSKKTSNGLETCIAEHVRGCTTDSDCLTKGNKYCLQYLDPNCEFGNIGIYCFIS